MLTDLKMVMKRLAAIENRLIYVEALVKSIQQKMAQFSCVRFSTTAEPEYVTEGKNGEDGSTGPKA